MPYYGVTTGGGGDGGTNDHRLLAGRSDAGQHPAAAVSITPLGPLGDAATVQKALEALAERGGAEETRPIAAVPVGAYKAVAFRPDDTVEPAGHDNLAHLSRLAGITLASATAGSAARVCAGGLARFNGWAWTPGAPVFVGQHGDLTQTPPETGFVQPVGVALGRDILWVQIERPIRRV